MGFQGGLKKRDPHSENAFTLSQNCTPRKKIRNVRAQCFAKIKIINNNKRKPTLNRALKFQIARF